MAGCEALKELLELAVLPDIEEAIDELFEGVADAKKADEDVKREYAELQELKEAFTALLEDMAEGELDDEECGQIYRELEEMMDASEQEDV